MRSKKSYIYPLSLLTISFFMFGFMTSLNDILTPHLKDLFRLSYAQAALLQLSFFAAYAFMSIPMGKLISKIQHKNGIILGFLITALGCFFFIPAATFKNYCIFLAGLFTIATGSTLLQISCNPYAILLGSPETATRRIVFMQAFNALGKMTAPIFGAIFIMGSTIFLFFNINTASNFSIQYAYAILGIFLISIAIAISLTKMPSVENYKAAQSYSLNKFWQHKQLYLGWIALFFAVGAEWSVSSSLVNYFELPDIGGIAAGTAANLVTLFWAGELTGRFLGGYFLNYIKAPHALLFNAMLAVILILISINSGGKLAVASILLLGFCNSIMFPVIFSLATRGLGNWATMASGILMVSIAGGGVISYLRGVAADYLGLQLAYLIPALCYAYIIFYAASGYDRKLALSYS